MEKAWRPGAWVLERQDECWARPRAEQCLLGDGSTVRHLLADGLEFPDDAHGTTTCHPSAPPSKHLRTPWRSVPAEQRIRPTGRSRTQLLYPPRARELHEAEAAQVDRSERAHVEPEIECRARPLHTPPSPMRYRPLFHGQNASCTSRTTASLGPMARTAPPALRIGQAPELPPVFRADWPPDATQGQCAALTTQRRQSSGGRKCVDA